MEHLYRKLKEYANTGYYPFHMPGHKRNTALIGSELPYELDITEIDGFDDLHHSNCRSMRRAYIMRRKRITL